MAPKNVDDKMSFMEHLGELRVRIMRVLYCLLIGYLIVRSTFLPRVLGVLMALAGLGGLTFLSPPFAKSLWPYNMLGSIGEVSLTLWLIVFAVNADRWKEQAGAAR